MRHRLIHEQAAVAFFPLTRCWTTSASEQHRLLTGFSIMGVCMMDESRENTLNIAVNWVEVLDRVLDVVFEPPAFLNTLALYSNVDLG